MLTQLMPALRMTLLLTVVTGLLYPVLVTGICQTLFRSQANGSLMSRNGQVVGSELIGQVFTKPEYFQMRPSAAGAGGYDAANYSGGSNLGPTSQKLMDRTKTSVQKLRADNPAYSAPLPADLATASASGLDPHLSPASIDVQLDRIARARGVMPQDIKRLADQLTEGRDLGFLGEARVNGLRLNLALDEKWPVKK